MANSFHGNVPGKDTGKKDGAGPKAMRGGKPDATPMRTANWPGLPGKAQPRRRDKSGTRVVHTSPKKEGLDC